MLWKESPGDKSELTAVDIGDEEISLNFPFLSVSHIVHDPIAHYILYPERSSEDNRATVVPHSSASHCCYFQHVFAPIRHSSMA